jgi:hypothetical protein
MPALVQQPGQLASNGSGLGSTSFTLLNNQLDGDVFAELEGKDPQGQVCIVPIA